MDNSLFAASRKGGCFLLGCHWCSATWCQRWNRRRGIGIKSGGSCQLALNSAAHSWLIYSKTYNTQLLMTDDARCNLMLILMLILLMLMLMLMLMLIRRVGCYYSCQLGNNNSKLCPRLQTAGFIRGPAYCTKFAWCDESRRGSLALIILAQSIFFFFSLFFPILFLFFHAPCTVHHNFIICISSVTWSMGMQVISILNDNSKIDRCPRYPCLEV